MMAHYTQASNWELVDIIYRFKRHEPLSKSELRELQEYLYRFADSRNVKPDDLLLIFDMAQDDLLDYYYSVLYDIYSIEAL